MQTTKPTGGGRGIDYSVLGLIGVIREEGERRKSVNGRETRDRRAKRME